MPDNPNKGVPSDHSGVVATPHTNSVQPHVRSKTVKTIRPLPESLITVFGQKLEKQGWDDLDRENSPGKIVEIFENTLAELISSTFPEKTIHIYPDDKP